MLFTSYGFLGFLLLLIPLYYLIPKRGQWILLLGGSYLFYFLAGPDYLLYILTTTVTTWYAAGRIEDNARAASACLKEHKEDWDKEERKAYKEGQKARRLQWFLGCLLLNLGILAVVKYTNFAIANVNGILSLLGQTRRLPFLSLALPMGISFYTFQAMGYLIDVYRGTAPAQRSLGRFALFVSFFPQLIQGPISRFGDLSQTLYGPHPFERKTVAFGLQRMLWGYFKKLVIADRALVAVKTLMADPGSYQGAYVLAIIILYSLELYADFTGGIDITIGVAQTLGIRLEENFIRPYFSKSLKEYWRRWHISMGTWFRDYIFYPASIAKPMQRLTRWTKAHWGAWAGRRLPVYLASFLTWFATGIWHGASWNFIVWALLNYVILMVSEELEPLYARFYQRFPQVEGKWLWRLFQVGRTAMLVSCLKVFDCYPDVSVTFRMFASLLTARNWSVLWDGSLLALGLTGLDYAILALGIVLLSAVSLVQRTGSVREKLTQKPYWLKFLLWYGLFLLVLLLGAYGVGYDASQFIYNQF